MENNLRLIDLFCLHLSFLFGYFIRNGLENPYLIPTYRNMAIVFMLIQIMVAIFFGTMKNVLKRGYWKEFSSTLKNVCLLELLCAFYLFTTQEAAEYSRIVLYLTGIIYAVLSYLVRISWKLINQFTDMGIVVHLSLMKAAHFTGKKQFVEKMGKYTVLTTSINYASPLQLLLKRILDIIGGFAGCILTAAAFLFVAPAIFLKSPGPVFFAQIRVGKNGKKFKMYKFRNMYMDAEERKKDLLEENRVKDGMMFKPDWDLRIIGARMVNGKPRKGIGNYIRDLSVDELPQFFNVLKGDRGIIGTTRKNLDFTRVSVA